MSEITLLLVDDHPVVCKGCRECFEENHDLKVIGEAADVVDAYRLFVSLTPDLLILDISLQGISGLELLRRVKFRDATAKVLIYTMHENPLLMKRSMQAGANGFLSKRNGPSLVIEAIHQILEGKTVVDPRLERHKAFQDKSMLESLTSREFEVFQLLAQGYTVKEIAGFLHLSPKTVGVYQTRILRKLDLANTTQLVLFAVQSRLVVLPT